MRRDGVGGRGWLVLFDTHIMADGSYCKCTYNTSPSPLPYGIVIIERHHVFLDKKTGLLKRQNLEISIRKIIYSASFQGVKDELEPVFTWKLFNRHVHNYGNVIQQMIIDTIRHPDLFVYFRI